MKKFNRIMRLMGLIIIMILSLAGGVPISINKKSEDTNEVKIELVEKRDTESELKEVDRT